MNGLRRLLVLLVCALCATCGDNSGPPVVVVIPMAVPFGVVSLHVTATLNGVPAQGMAIADNNVQPFSLELPMGSTGTLAVTISGWSSTTAIVATGMGSIAVPASGQAVLDIPLMAQSPAVAVALTAVAATRGSIKGGAAVTLTGQLFQPGATVAFQSLAGQPTVQAMATDVQVVSATEITAVTPAWTGPPGRVQVTVQNPNGQMATKSNAYDYVPYALSYSTANYTVAGGSLHAAVADFDGDGTQDLAVASAALGQVQIMLNNGHGVFTPLESGPITVCAGLAPVPAIDVFAGQLTRTAKRKDLLVRCGLQQLETVLAPLTTKASTRAVVFPAKTPLQWMAVSDMNADGAVDVAVTSQSTSDTGSGVLLNNGNGVFPAVAVTLAPMFSDAFPGDLGAVATGTVYHPGDLLIQSFDDASLDLHENKSSATSASFLLTKQISYAKTDLAQSLLLADIDGNGTLDALVVASASTATTLLPTSLLSLSGTTKAVDAVCRPPLAATGMVLGDLDGDGLPDLLSGRTDDNSVQIYTGNGDGTFNSPAVIPTPGLAQGVAIADLNGDGLPDLIVTNTSPAQNQVSVLLNKGP